MRQNRVVKWLENAKKRQQEHAKRAATAAERRAEILATVEGSTLSQESRPFTRGDVVWGTAFPSMRAAYEALITDAHSLGYDAVLGVGFTSPATDGISTQPSVQFVAYGTGVTWNDSPQ
ncbi:hypothetical protein ACWC9U_22205 [Streptomyces sp. 900116325]